MGPPRSVEVAPERLAGWVRRFADSHGEVTWSVVHDDEHDQAASPSAYLATAADGSWARLRSWQAPVGSPAGPLVGLDGSARDGSAWDETVSAWATPTALLIVLVRRGGYAVAVTSPAGELLAHKVGTRYVQSRTAAGGWSQQRYARRRANQADELVGAVVGHGGRVLAEGEAVLDPGAVGGAVLGGDRTLAAEALEGLATGAQARLLDLPRRGLWDLPDPRRTVLEEAVRRGRAVRVEVRNA